MLQRFRWPTAILACSFALLAACGDGDDQDETDVGGGDAGDVSGGDATPDVDEDTTPDVDEDTAPDVVEDVTPDADVVEDVTPDADVVEDVTPDADVVEDVTPDADVVEDVTPDADVVEDVTPDADVVEDVTPDSDTITECDPGFELIEGTCVNIDECERGLDECADNATCTDVDGTYECACDEGFFGNGFFCVDDPCVIYEPGSFTRPDNSPDTVDCLAPSVCLARGSGGPIYNSLVETAADAPGCGEAGPAGTEWAVGPCAGNEGPFTGFVDATGCSPRSAVGQTLCLHVIAEDLYFDIDFTSYSGGGPGGGFAYDRVLVGGGVCAVGATCDFDTETTDVTCTCQSGTTGDGEASCDDIDECTEGTDTCSGGAVCVNTYGGFDCACPEGSEFNGDLVCVDINECIRGLDDCGDGATCQNLDPGFTCTCEPGFRLDAENNCVNIDECAEGLDDCGATSTCSDLTPGFECLCDEFTELDVDNECVDVNECDADPCDPNATCTNLDAAGFTCACNDGWRGDGFTCEEELPCDPACGDNGVCIQNIAVGGGAGAGAPLDLICVCEDGYTGDGFTCENVDECSGLDTIRVDHEGGGAPDCITADVCLTRPTGGGGFYNAAVPGDEINAQCPGKFATGGNPTGTRWALGTCDTPDLEFTTLTGLWGCGLGRNIVDAPLCVEITSTGQRVDLIVRYWGGSGSDGAFIYERTALDTCDINASCTDTVGGFDCACDDLFVGDGFECVYDGPCDLECGDNAECVRLDDGPACACLPGFETDRDSGLCVDSNECGGTVDVTRAAGDPADCLTPDVCLTRSTEGGSLYNEAQEDAPPSGGCGFTGPVDVERPAGTEWARGACGTPGQRFTTFDRLHDCDPPSLVDTTVCMRAIASGREFSITFTDWQIGRETDPPYGGFAYTRTEASPCDDDATCTNTPGAFECACNDDFVGDGFSCVFAGECDLDCGVGVCENDDDGPTCVCPTGYEFADGTCVDLDECNGTVSVSYRPFDGEPDCLTDELCFARSAGGGPIYNAVRDRSAAGAECGGGFPTGALWFPGPCEGAIDGGFEPGLLAAVSCSGADVEGSSLCMQDAASGHWIDITFEDWGRSRDGRAGEFAYTRDVVPPCAVEATCTNTPGSFTCECPEGFIGDGFTCVPDVACDLSCPENAACAVVDGTPECVCEPGFGDEDGACVDIDACANTTPASVTYTPGDDPFCLTPTVCLARGESNLIYNAFYEGAYTDAAPTATLWAYGTCDEAVGFFDFDALTAGSPPALVGREVCMWSLDDDRAFDITFDEWANGRDSPVPGAFAYTFTEAFVNPCGDNALCTDGAAGAFTCECPDGFEGDPLVGCVPIDNCAGDPCGAGNTCVSQLDGYACVCEGQSVTFTNPSFEGLEDCISPDVCISRSDAGPIYNTLLDEEINGSVSCNLPRPSGTLWRFGACDEYFGFAPFLSDGYADCGPPSIVGEASCLYLTESGVQLDVTFNSWASGGDFVPGLDVEPFGEGAPSGGGFSYTRDVVTFNEACPGFAP